MGKRKHGRRRGATAPNVGVRRAGVRRAAGRGRRFEPHLVDAVIDAAVSSCGGGDSTGLTDAIRLLVLGPPGADGDGAAGDALVDRALGRRLVDAVAGAWSRGWQPADLARVTARQLGRAHARLVASAAVREAQLHPPATVSARWRAQLDEIDPGDGRTAGAAGGAAAADDRWAVPGPPNGRGQAVRVAVDVLALLLRRLPAVPKLGPAPGEAAASGRADGHDADARILHRVRALLAKAESTTFPEEAEALTAKAQELMARHAIDGAVLAAARGTGPRVGARRLAVDDPYAAAKALLLEAISSANRCRSVWSRGYGHATVFGDDGDLDAVELLYTSLLVQAARAMLAAGRGGGPATGGRTRSFRQSFLVAFATRIGARLREAVAEATASYADRRDALLPVLADRRRAADEACEQVFPDVRATSLSANDWAGWHAGQRAAEEAQLDVHTSVGAGAAAG